MNVTWLRQKTSLLQGLTFELLGLFNRAAVMTLPAAVNRALKARGAFAGVGERATVS